MLVMHVQIFAQTQSMFEQYMKLLIKVLRNQLTNFDLKVNKFKIEIKNKVNGLKNIKFIDRAYLTLRIF